MTSHRDLPALSPLFGQRFSSAFHCIPLTTTRVSDKSMISKRDDDLSLIIDICVVVLPRLASNKGLIFCTALKQYMEIFLSSSTIDAEHANQRRHRVLSSSSKIQVLATM
eukprot:scaffold16072_cov142-Skeletonema_marinoi.AAC.3